MEVKRNIPSLYHFCNKSDILYFSMQESSPLQIIIWIWLNMSIKQGLETLP